MAGGFTWGSDPSGKVTVNLVITKASPPTTATTTPPASSTTTTTTVARPHGPLPFTGAPVPLELAGSFGLLAAGLLAVVAGRRRDRAGPHASSSVRHGG